MPNGDPLGITEREPSRAETLRAAFKGAIPGLIAGGGLGALRSALTGESDFLRSTLAGALLGGAGTAGATYLAKAGPFARGGMGGKAFEAGGEAMTRAMLEGQPIPVAAARSLGAGTASLLTGRGRFAPEEREALVQQFLQSKLPTMGGWKRRTQLAGDVIERLSGGEPRRALRRLKALEQVAPDMSTKALVSEAIERLQGGRFRREEERKALGAIAKGLGRRSALYEQMTPTLQQMHELKRKFAEGEIDYPELSKRFGIVTGRFGRKGEEAERFRNFIREIIARPVSAKPTTAVEKAVMDVPQIGTLMERAMGRGR